MIDSNYIHDHLDEIKDMLKKRNVSLDLEQLLSLNAKRVSLIQKIEEVRANRNKLAKTKTPSESDRRAGKAFKEELKILEPELAAVNQEYHDLLWQVPNLLHPDAPVGSDESENVVVAEHGEKPTFDFKALDHFDLGNNLELFDFEKGASVTGSQWYFLKNDGVLLEMSLMRFAVDFLISEGFQLLQTPDVAKLSVLNGTGYNPRGPETQVYTLSGGELGLIGTAEITLGGYHKDEVLAEKSLPLKYCGFSHCFRTEAGGYGRYSKGLYRVHQFSKVEMFIYCTPEKSDEMHEYLRGLEEKIYQKLAIPYRVVDIASGDLGAAAYRKYDLEAWLPGRGDWGEITSTSNTTDYQSSRLNIKYRTSDNSSIHVHTLNGTAIASSRSIIAILENYQNKDGSITVPDVLIPYMGKKKIKKN